MDTHGISITQVQLLDLHRITTLRLRGQLLQQEAATSPLVVIQATLDTGTFDISLLSDTTSSLDSLSESHILIDQRLVALEEHLSAYGDITLSHITRATTNIHLIIRLQDKTRSSVDHKTVTQGEGKGLGKCPGTGGRHRIDDTT